MSCTTIVNSSICVEANVKVSADVEVGEVCTHCIGKPYYRRCRRGNQCVYIAFQRLGVQFPLIFTPKIVATPAGVVCENISAGEHTECQNPNNCKAEPCYDNEMNPYGNEENCYHSERNPYMDTNNSYTNSDDFVFVNQNTESACDQPIRTCENNKYEGRQQGYIFRNRRNTCDRRCRRNDPFSMIAALFGVSWLSMSPNFSTKERKNLIR